MLPVHKQLGGAAKLIAAGVSLIGLWWVIGFELPRALAGKPDSAGTFGDSFGAANALFSGLALGGVVLAILLQREELALQRRELELTREELAAAARAQEASHRALAEQAWVQLRTARLNALSLLVDIEAAQAANLKPYDPRYGPVRARLERLHAEITKQADELDTLVAEGTQANA